jgi:hypothetical protein
VAIVKVKGNAGNNRSLINGHAAAMEALWSPQVHRAGPSRLPPGSFFAARGNPPNY